MHGGGGGIGYGIGYIYGGHCSSPWYSSCGGEGVMCGGGVGIGYGGHCSSPWYSICGGEGVMCQRRFDRVVGVDNYWITCPMSCMARVVYRRA